MDQQNLKNTFYDKFKGRKILECIQCGTCSGSCTFSDKMDHAPREIFALIRDNEIKEVLKSNTMWLCTSCYMCMTRCPKEIPVTDLIYSLKEMTIKTDMFSSTSKAIDLSNSFAKNVKKFGRVTEPLVMAIYAIKHRGFSSFFLEI